ncbi:MAG TPA: hypothetical protein PKX23_09470, partial [Verrucomicrobiota bacterium]|nr:hypothetical protein [Verrucomicrobiota bacterium]
MKGVFLAAALGLAVASPSPGAVVSPEAARAALLKATEYLQSLATEGGYLWSYSADLKDRRGETQATATQIWVQPPGTPAVGEALL